MMVAMLVILLAVYALILLGLILLLRRLQVPAKWAILASFLVYGFVAGVLAAWIWPLDSSTYANVFATLLGDRLYTLAIRFLGDEYSAQAHSTIPWPLRVPQVYVPVSVVVCGLAGWLLQWAYNRRDRGRNRA